MHEAFDSETRRQSNERFEVQWNVEKGLLTPDDAERWASDNQRLPFYLAGLSEASAMSSQIWRLPYAVIWIAFRNSDMFEREVASHNFWKKFVWQNAIKEGQALSLVQSETLLRASLLSGELNAFGAVAWQKDYLSSGPVRQIKRIEWTNLVWTRDADGVLTEPVEGEPRYLDAFVLRDEVVSRWKSIPKAEVLTSDVDAVRQSAAPPLRRPPGARPEKAERIKAAMRAMPREQLMAMKNAEMAVLFKASASYCGGLRLEIAAEPNSVQ